MLLVHILCSSLLPVRAITASSFNPADGATGVAVDANLVLTLDEAWEDGATNYIYIKDSNGTTFASYDMTGSPSQITGATTTTLTINPSSSLAYSTNYYVLIDDDIIYDSGWSNTYSIPATTTWNFKTVGNLDTTAPVRISFDPVDNGTCVFLNNDLVITFDEN
ncbi:MAG: Ig-like domain-containing protein, partial [Candidatus Melainabacteria bacterium]|nr:Ig-like domain-containing protein [Candidatus Melainabacteria bacterium]